MATATVRVTIRGLCMLVPEQDALHVLMPGMPAHAHQSLDGDGSASAAPAHGAAGSTTSGEPHYAHLAYDRAHKAGNASGPSQHYDHFCFNGSALQFIRSAQSPLDPAIYPDRVVRLDDRACFAGVDRGCVGPTPGQRMTARAVLPTGRVTDYLHAPDDWYTVEHPAECNGTAGSRTQQMAHGLVWELGTFEAPVRLGDLVALRHLASGAPAGTPNEDTLLHPINGAIDFLLFHVPEEERPRADGTIPTPEGDGTAHFTAYYEVGKGKPNKRVKPTKVNKALLVGATCMITQAQFASDLVSDGADQPASDARAAASSASTLAQGSSPLTSTSR